jgi:hypothetical protein
MYFLNFLDRNAIVNGKLNGLDKDIGLKGTEYNTCVSIFFVGLVVSILRILNLQFRLILAHRYLLGQVPSNLLLTRIKPAYYMAGWMMAWAIVSTLMCVVKDYHGLIACR